MLVLMLGDVIGAPGRRALNDILPGFKQSFGVDFIIANSENIAGGIGVTPSTAREMINAGVDVLTSGNHIWAHKDILPFLESEDIPLLRPLNYPPGVPGRGYLIHRQVMVINLIGRTFMGNYDCPFRAMDHLLETVKSLPPVIIVDFHAEATSEKVALGRYLNGRVTAVMGTHTHVGTIDSSILNGGTAYVTDIGMTGPVDSIIGDDPDAVISRFLTMIPARLSAGKGKTVLNGILMKIDEKTGKALTIDRVSREVG